MPKTKSSQSTTFSKLCSEFDAFAKAEKTPSKGGKKAGEKAPRATLDYLLKMENGKFLPEFTFQCGEKDSCRFAIYQKFDGDKKIIGASVGGRIPLGKS